jgi:hypothetical protein
VREDDHEARAAVRWGFHVDRAAQPFRDLAADEQADTHAPGPAGSAALAGARRLVVAIEDPVALLG